MSESLIQRRFKGSIETNGSSFTVGAQERIGIVQHLSQDLAQTYLSESEISTLSRPIRMVIVPYDDETVESDTVIFDGQTVMVQKVIDSLFRDERTHKILIWA